MILGEKSKGYKKVGGYWEKRVEDTGRRLDDIERKE